MHVAIDARLAHYSAGGIARYTLELATSLASTAPQHRFTLLRSGRQRRGLPSAHNLRSVAVLTPPHHRWEQLTLALEVLRLRPDLLHSPDFIPLSRRSFRSVITVHDLVFLRVIYHGVSKRFRPIESEAPLTAVRARYGLHKPYVLFLGTFEPRKNVTTLVRAFGLGRMRHDVLLALVGRRGWL